MKFKYKNAKWKFPFANGHHHHYHCCLTNNPLVKYKIKNIKSWNDLNRLNELIHKKELTDDELTEKLELQSKLKSKYSFIKTHSIYYSELSMLFKMSRDDSHSEPNDEEDDIENENE